MTAPLPVPRVPAPTEGVLLILRAESIVFFIAGVLLYLQLNGNALWLLPLLLAPDFSMIGYLRGSRLGAITYNLVHNWRRH